MNKGWWRTWYGVPVALIMSVIGFCFHPIQCVGDWLFYWNEFGKKGSCEYPIGWWTILVRSCADIDMSCR